MKKIAPYIVLFLLIMVAWESMVEPYHMSFMFDDGDFDGPVGGLLAVLFAGGGMIIGVLALIFAAVVVAVVFAGVGLLAVSGLVLGALIVAAVIAPFLLPVLIPVAIIWYLMKRDRKNRSRLNAQADLKQAAAQA